MFRFWLWKFLADLFKVLVVFLLFVDLFDHDLGGVAEKVFQFLALFDLLEDEFVLIIFEDVVGEGELLAVVEEGGERGRGEEWVDD